MFFKAQGTIGFNMKPLTKNLFGMIRVLSILFLVSLLVDGCKKESEMGRVLFCTNSAIINCPFSIEISIDNIIVDTLSAASENKSLECECPESYNIGTLIDLELGQHIYYANELNCQGSNIINEWSGSFEIFENNCEIMNLDILELDTGHNTW